MSPHEKAVAAINARLERLQVNLREAKGEAQPPLFQSMVALIGLSEGLNDFASAVAAHAQKRQERLKKETEAHAAQHAEMLADAQELLAKLKASPGDKAVRKEIERAQRAMEGIQKAARRGANEYQRELAPSLAMIDHLAGNVRRLAEAEQIEALPRQLKIAVEQVRALYAVHPTLAKDMVDVPGWEKAIGTAITQASGFHAAFAAAAEVLVLAIELSALTVAEKLPDTADDAIQRARAATAAALKRIAGRLTDQA